MLLSKRTIHCLFLHFFTFLKKLFLIIINALSFYNNVDLSDLYVVLSDLYIDLSDLYVDFSDHYVDLSPIHLLEKCRRQRVT